MGRDVLLKPDAMELLPPTVPTSTAPRSAPTGAGAGAGAATTPAPVGGTAGVAPPTPPPVVLVGATATPVVAGGGVDDVGTIDAEIGGNADDDVPDDCDACNSNGVLGANPSDVILVVNGDNGDNGPGVDN
jgi:hypothetical protein